MNRNLYALLLMLLVIVAQPINAISAGIADYLILQDIGLFKLSKLHKSLPGELPIGGPKSYEKAAVVSSVGHFSDHVDMTYEVDYFDFTRAYPSPTIHVTQHAGGDSDKWLLHEIEQQYRDPDNLLASVIEDTSLEIVNGNKIFFYGGGIVSYSWLSNNVAVFIEYSNFGEARPEPLEVINAYLQKYPSTLPATLALNSSHDIQWIKDEMERRLWLGDKWFAQITESDPKLSEKLREIVKSMGVFLAFREKYYSGDSADEEKIKLEDYAAKLDKESLLKKQTEYKQWWNDNKGFSMALTSMHFTHSFKNFWRKMVSVFCRMFRFVTGWVHN